MIPVFIKRVLVLVCGTLWLAGCEQSVEPPAAPPRATDPIQFPEEPSTIGVDLAVDLAGLERDLEKEIPRALWSISEKGVTCVPSKKVDLALFKVKTPKLKCNIEGTVTRGKLRISGRGRKIILTMPVRAKVRARDIGGIFKETGTAAADFRVGLRLDITREWKLRSNVDVNHTWSQEPGIDFLGKRITFTDKADRELTKLHRKIEVGLERALARIKLRPAAERGWAAAHAVLELNRENPPVWAQIKPHRFHFGGYSISGKNLRMTLGLEGSLQTRIGQKPEPAEPGPLPPIEHLAVKPGYAVLRVPVISDYAVLEPVITKALAKRARRPFALGEYGSVQARFSDIEVYGTTGNRIAVGITFAADSNLALWKQARGRIWLSAKPVNAPNSREVGFSEVAVTGETDMVGESLLFALANSADLQSTISGALKQNFENDFGKLRGKIDRAIASRKDGPLAYSVTLDEISMGRLVAYGQGLYLPVEMRARMKAELVKMK